MTVPQIIAPANFTTYSSNPSSDNQKKQLSDLLKGSFFNKRLEGSSLHDRMIKISFYSQLHNSTINAKTLLQNLVNEEHYYARIESYIKTDQTFKQILPTDLHRTSSLQNDIAFYVDKFKLIKPEPTPGAKKLFEFIDLTAKENPHLLVGIIYVLYAKIFEGRVTCNDTINWLKKNMDDWEQLPEKNNGVTFWSFRNISCLKNATAIKVEFIEGINGYEKNLNQELLQRLPEITSQAFSNLMDSIESVTESSLANKNIAQLLPEDPLPVTTKIARLFMLILISGLFIRLITK